MKRYTFALILSLVCGISPATAQGTPISDLITVEGDVPRRLMGYGLVVGLDGTGDRSLGTASGSSHTVRSVANLLERFGIRVPEEQLRTRNVAAVLVTAEVSPYARSGSRFDVQIGSVGDARSLEGGVLWMTPLTAAAGTGAVASAQGPVLIFGADDTRRLSRRSGSASIPQGGVLEVGAGRASGGDDLRLLLRNPDAVTASRIRDAVNAELGEGTAVIEDKGSVRIAQLPTGLSATEVLARIEVLDIKVVPESRIVVNSRTGSVVAGGALRVGVASVSHGDITLTVGPPTGQDIPPATGRAHVVEGASVQDIVGALHIAGARPSEIAHILSALNRVGALRAEVEIR